MPDFRTRLWDWFAAGGAVALVAVGMWVQNQQNMIDEQRRDLDEIKNLMIEHAESDAHNRAAIWIAELQIKVTANERKLDMLMATLERIERSLSRVGYPPAPQ